MNITCRQLIDANFAHRILKSEHPKKQKQTFTIYIRNKNYLLFIIIIYKNVLGEKISGQPRMIQLWV